MKAYLLPALLAIFCTSAHTQIPKIDPSGRTELARKKEAQFRKLLVSERQATANQDMYDVKYYSLDLTPDPESTVLTGVVEMVGEVTGTSLDEVELNFWDGMTITDIHASHNSTLQLGYVHTDDILSIDLDSTYSQGEEFSLVIAYNGRPQNSGYGSFSFGSYGGEPMIGTISEPFGARSWWPCKDVPSDKADSVDIRVTVPSDLIVASNGTLREKETEGGMTTYWWHEAYAITTYLVSLAIHPFTVTYDDYLYNDGTDTMKIHFYMFPDHADDLSPLNDMVKEMISFFSDVFGEYPFVKEKYGHADFLWGGAMEHQTCTSFGFWGEWVYAHELAHQWWGDMITCDSFHHIWLNEGFASYSEALWAEHAYGDLFGPGMASFYQMQANLYLGPGTVYVEDPENESIFDGGLSYNKASWVLHMLRHVVGDSTFFGILKAYYSSPDHGYGTATTEGFRAICEQVSGMDLETFFHQWIYESFHPVYAMNWTQIDERLALVIQQVQETGPVFEMPVDVQVICTDTTFTETVENGESVQLFSIPIPEGQTVEDVLLDPGDWILKEIAPPPDPDVTVAPPFLESGMEEVDLTVDFSGVIPSTVATASAIITRYGFSSGDSISLYDDGDHGDGESNDGVWGGSVAVGSGEFTYTIDIVAEDSVGLVYEYWDVARITTIGPVVYHGIEFLTDSIPNPGDYLIFQLSLRNDGSTATATDIGVQFAPRDASVSVYEKIGNPEYGDIPAGSIISTGGGAYMLEISEDYPSGADLTVDLSIFSEGFYFWSDSFSVYVEPPLGIAGEALSLPDVYALHSNYPNPFNPVTTLRYDLPERSEVLLAVYDILGRRVATLVKGVEQGGFRSVMWDGKDDFGNEVGTGVYLYRIQVSDFVSTRKMILLR